MSYGFEVRGPNNEIYNDSEEKGTFLIAKKRVRLISGVTGLVKIHEAYHDLLDNNINHLHIVCSNIHISDNFFKFINPDKIIIINDSVYIYSKISVSGNFSPVSPALLKKMESSSAFSVHALDPSYNFTRRPEGRLFGGNSADYYSLEKRCAALLYNTFSRMSSNEYALYIQTLGNSSYKSLHKSVIRYVIDGIQQNCINNHAWNDFAGKMWDCPYIRRGVVWLNILEDLYDSYYNVNTQRLSGIGRYLKRDVESLRDNLDLSYNFIVDLVNVYIKIAKGFHWGTTGVMYTDDYASRDRTYYYVPDRITYRGGPGGFITVWGINSSGKLDVISDKSTLTLYKEMLFRENQYSLSKLLTEEVISNGNDEYLDVMLLGSS